MNGQFYSIRRHLAERGVNLDSPSFKCVREHLALVKKKLHKDGLGNLPNRASSLSAQEVHTLFETKTAGVQSPVALNNAMAIMIMWLGRRGYTELYRTRLGDIKVIVNEGVPVLTLCKERVSKTRQGENPQHVRFGVPWLSSMEDESRCPVTIYQTLVSMRPQGMMDPESHLLLTPISGIHKDCRKQLNQGPPWFKQSPMGLDTVGKIVKTMCVTAGIDISNRKISNSSMRKMTVSTLVEGGFSAADIVKYLNTLVTEARPVSSTTPPFPPTLGAELAKLLWVVKQLSLPRNQPLLS